MIDVTFFIEIIPQLLAGLPLTLKLAGTSLLFGFVLALVLALAQQGQHRLATWPIRTFVAVFRGTPLLVQIFLIYYGLGQFRPSLQALGLWGLFREPYWCAILALTLNTAAYGSEILRGAIKNVPRGLGEAAQALGMSRFLTLRLVVLPIAFRQAIPAYGNEIILMVKGTSLASIITLLEVTGIARNLISESYRAIEVFMAAGAIYLLLNFLIVRAIAILESRMTPYRSRG
ncbi:amino acid ABC transporter membrane protein 2, PAAT family [Rhizobium sp. RU33A]|uniref:ABC transporter permease n=1 Tax=Rhizobium sp. RU33A TaxID=1907413 RepID=UPI0009543640|nr:ABC transporter permease [Rhizobium sp. RU33A]SIQ85492.1 amino acid ABC transporter membrane protein 2, PAAT family [Rhizobium sp. RU33A]